MQIFIRKRVRVGGVKINRRRAILILQREQQQKRKMMNNAQHKSPQLR